MSEGLISQDFQSSQCPVDFPGRFQSCWYLQLASLLLPTPVLTGKVGCGWLEEQGSGFKSRGLLF